MITLCIDTSSATCACALIKNGKIIEDIILNNGLNHSQTLLPTVKEILDNHNLKIPDIANIALTVGPGSFTGVKISAATVKGLAFTHNIPCVAISTLEALAYNKISDGSVCCVMDARRGMLYNAIFDIKQGVAVRRNQDRQISNEELFLEIKDQDIFITGDGTDLFGKYCNEHNYFPKTAKNEYKFVRGFGIYKAAENCGFKKCDHKKLVPEYLRLPQAERERMEREGKIL